MVSASLMVEERVVSTVTRHTLLESFLAIVVRSSLAVVIDASKDQAASIVGQAWPGVIVPLSIGSGSGWM